jgi:hypothetical protein
MAISRSEGFLRDTTPYSPMEVNRLVDPKNTDELILRHVDCFSRDDVALYPKRQKCSQLWELKILREKKCFRMLLE